MDHDKGLVEDTDEITDDERAITRKELEEAATLMGGVTALTEALGVSRAVFYHWLKTGVDGRRAIELETLVNRTTGSDAISRRRLCPWFFRGMAVDHAEEEV